VCEVSLRIYRRPDGPEAQSASCPISRARAVRGPSVLWLHRPPPRLKGGFKLRRCPLRAISPQEVNASLVRDEGNTLSLNRVYSAVPEIDPQAGTPRCQRMGTSVIENRPTRPPRSSLKRLTQDSCHFVPAHPHSDGADCSWSHAGRDPPVWPIDAGGQHDEAKNNQGGHCSPSPTATHSVPPSGIRGHSSFYPAADLLEPGGLHPGIGVIPGSGGGLAGGTQVSSGGLFKI
jgi:hypothetical protein